MGFWPVVLNVLRNSDVVLLVVDARMPEVSRNSEIVLKAERMGKRVVFVYNKVDLVSGHLKDEENIFFVSALKRRGVRKLRKFLEDEARDWKKESLRVGVVGYPNAGKSSLINVLTGSSEKVKSVSGTTRKTKWIRMGRLRIMDSPGVIPAGDDKIRVGLTASKDPHKIKNPEKVALSLLRKGKIGEAVRKFYGTDEVKDYEAFLDIGKKKGFLLKGGEVDEVRTAIRIIDDWQKGKIGLR